MPAFSPISTVDFTEVSVYHPGTRSGGAIFTVSACGGFLMAASGCIIYIYEINRSHQDESLANRAGYMRPITSIICPRRVLACSMDTSSQRYAIAALLDNHMGIVCDITTSDRTRRLESSKNSRKEKAKSGLICCARTTAEHVHDAESCSGPSLMDHVSLSSSSSNNGAEGSEIPFVFPGIASSPQLAPQRETSRPRARTLEDGDAVHFAHMDMPSKYCRTQPLLLNCGIGLWLP